MTAASVGNAVYRLIELGKFDALRKFVPDEFDWSQVCGPGNILPLCFAVWFCNCSPEMVQWMIEQGADPLLEHPTTSAVWKAAKENRIEGTEIQVPLAGQCALTFVLEQMAQLKKGKGGADWSEKLRHKEATLEVLIKCSPAKRRNLCVPQSLVDTWESVREMSSTHNVVFEAADGEVSAHDLILVAASPVLKAMLESAMKEGSSKKVTIKDSSSAGVRLFVDMLYTSSTRDEPDYKTVMVALDLAHRWQVQGVVAVLSAMLQKMITLDSFVAIAEEAVLKDLTSLQRSCRTFGSTNAKVKAMLKKGTLPAAVRKLLGQAEAPAAEEQGKQKRRRTFCAS